MAAPQLVEAEIKVPDRIVLTFDQPLDDGVKVPLTSFSVNYGRIPIVAYTWRGTATIMLKLARRMDAHDKLELNYQPPDDPEKALRAPIPSNSNRVVIQRNVVRAFFKVPVKNQIRPDEIDWNANSNLGVSNAHYYGGDSDGVDPEQWTAHDACGNEVTFADTSTVHHQDRMSGRGTGSGDISGAVTDDRIYAAGYPDYPIGSRPDPKTATPDDFILAFGLKEAIQLTNIENSDATSPNTAKLWMAIQDATALIDNYIVQASRGGKLLISSNRRRTALIIARYYLDTVRRREDVRTDYEMAVKEIERASSMEDVVRPDPPWWQDVCNPWRGCGVRSHTIPQYYNGVSGKGLSGWWKDSAFLERNDWRYSRLNSEANNDLPNRRAGTVRKDDDPRLPAQPADDGGIRYSGTSSSAP